MFYSYLNSIKQKTIFILLVFKPITCSNNLYNFLKSLCILIYVSADIKPIHRDRYVSGPSESVTDTATLNHIQEFGMIRSAADHSVFYHHSSTGKCIYLIVYVDDIVITGTDQDGIQKLKQHLFSYFQTKDLGKLKYFLGIEVAQSNSGLVISQRKYTLDILTDTGMLDCKPVDTPIDPNVKLVPSQGELLQDPGRYRRLVGKLNYLTITQPNISFPISVVSQFLQSPYDSH